MTTWIESSNTHQDGTPVTTRIKIDEMAEDIWFTDAAYAEVSDDVADILANNLPPISELASPPSSPGTYFGDASDNTTIQINLSDGVFDAATVQSLDADSVSTEDVVTERGGIKNGLSRPKEMLSHSRMPGRRQATVCIIYDDGLIEEKNELFPVHEEKGAPYGSALISDRLGTDGYFDEQDIHDLVTSNVDWEPISHGRKSLRLQRAHLTSAVSAGDTVIEVNNKTPFREGYEYQIIAPGTHERFVVSNRNETTLTLESGLDSAYDADRQIAPTKRTLELDIGGCKKDLGEMGLTANGHVFSGNSTYGPIGQQITSEYFGWSRSDMNAGSQYVGGRNSVPINRYALNGTLIKQLSDTEQQTRLDAIEANNELGVFYGHGGAETATEVSNFIDNVQARDIDIVTPTEAVARFATPTDIVTPTNRVAESDRTLYYPFLKSSGSDIYDASGQNNDGSFVQNPQRVETSLGRGARITETDGNRIQIPHDQSLNPGTGSWTFTAWVRYQSNPGRILDKGDIYFGQVGKQTQLRFWLNDGTNSNDANLQLTHLNSGDLFQVAAVRDADASEIRVFANATHDRAGNSTSDSTGDVNPTSDLYLGGDSSSTWGMDLFAPQIYQRALSREELLSMHLSTVGSQAVEGDLRTVDSGKGMVVTTPDGTAQYRIRVDNTGAITTDQL